MIKTIQTVISWAVILYVPYYIYINIKKQQDKKKKGGKKNDTNERYEFIYKSD